MGQNYLNKTVFEAALERINFVYDECDDVIVSMSGGKDSTVLYNLTKQVARERGRLPLKVFWLDQEAEWAATGEYMRSVMYDPEVKPYWYQVPFSFTNSLSLEENYLSVWDEKKRDVWIREQDPLSIKVSPVKSDRFHHLMWKLTRHCDNEDSKHTGVMIGMRVSESPRRRLAITNGKGWYKGITWCHKLKPKANNRGFWPIYDFTDADIWTAIAKNNWAYNGVYDQMYRQGYAPKDMRVSALIHETAWRNLQKLQEIEPGVYDKFVKRITGTNCFTQFQKDIMPKELPGFFKDWKEYRDYLLLHLVKPEYHDLFRKRWATVGKWGGQDGEDWYRLHVREVMIQDIDGTLNDNFRVKSDRKQYFDPDGEFKTMERKRFARFMNGEEQDVVGNV